MLWLNSRPREIMIEITPAYSLGGIGGASGWKIFGFSVVAPRIHVIAISSFGNLSSTYAENAGISVNGTTGPPYEGTFELPYSIQNGGSGSQIGAQGKAKGTVTYSTWQAYAEVDCYMVGGMPLYALFMFPDFAIDASVGSTYMIYEVI